HQTSPSARMLEQNPLHTIRGPNPDAILRLQAKIEQTTRQAAGRSGQLGPGEADILVARYQRFAVRKPFRRFHQRLWDRLIEQRLNWTAGITQHSNTPPLQFVFDVNQMQPLGRDRRPGKSPIAGLENGLDLTGSEFSGSHIQQSSNDGAHHVLEKSVAPDPEDPLLLASIPARLVDCPDPILDLARAGAKRREVMCA